MTHVTQGQVESELCIVFMTSGVVEMDGIVVIHVTNTYIPDKNMACKLTNTQRKIGAFPILSSLALFTHLTPTLLRQMVV